MNPISKWLSKKALVAFALMLGASAFVSAETLAVSCPGITRGSHPYGLTHPAFNCYTDNTELGRVYSGDQREQNFVRLTTDGSNWSDNVTVTENGERVRIFVYMHNSAKDGQYPARNTKLIVDWSDPSNVFAQISASNTNPGSVDDNGRINIPAGKILSGDQVIIQPDEDSNRGTVTQSIEDGATRVVLNFGNYLGSYSHQQGVYVDLLLEDRPTTPAIDIIKDDSTPNSADTDGADTQTINYGETATFSIRVVNTGNEALENVEITDALTPACNRTPGQTTPLIAAQGNGDNFFDPGEEFAYTCNATNVTEAFTNVARVDGTSVVDGQNVNHTDPTVVELITTPDIQIDKDDSTPGTPDADGDDRQTVEEGGTATFTITVFNDGFIPLRNVVITDPKTPNCNRSDAQTQPLIRAVGNGDNLFDPGEEFTYTCEATNVTEAFTNLARVTGDPIDGQAQVVDSNTTDVVLMTVPSINIDKDDSTPGTIDTDGDDNQNVFEGDSAVFTITVTNDGAESLENVVITDELAPVCNRNAGQTAPLIAAQGNGDNLFDPQESFTYQCTQTDVRRGYTNVAVVTGDSVVDGVEVTDNDPTIVNVPPRVEIDIDKDDSTPGDADTDGDDTQTVETGGEATFTITVTNLGVDDLRDVVITDPNAPACDRSAAQTASLIRAQGNGDAILNAATSTADAESFTYTCVDPNVTGPYTNTANVVGVGVTLGSLTTDEDPTIVETTDPEPPSINIDKDDSTPGTADNDGDDTQTVDYNGTANFTITVTNDGGVGLERVSVGDVQEPNCALSVQEALVFIQNTGNNDTVFDPAESFTYTCTSSNVTEDFTNTADVIGFSIATGEKVVDEDPTVVVVRPQPICSESSFNTDTTTPGSTVTYSWTTENVPSDAQLMCSGAGVDFMEAIGTASSRDIQIPATAANGDVLTCKILMPNGTELCRDTVTVQVGTPSINIDKDDQDNTDDTQQIERNGTANFTITVTNDGPIALRNVVITDALAPSCARTAAQTAGLYDGDTFDPTETFTYTCSADEWTSATNSATVTANPVTPIPGTPQVTDTDVTNITFPGGGTDNPEISIDKDDQDNTDDTQEITRGTTAAFTITVTNTGDVALTEVTVTDNLAPNCERTAAQTAGLYDGTTFDPNESFTYECEQDNWRFATNEAITSGTPTNGDPVVTDSDSTAITFPGGGGGGGGGGSVTSHPTVGVCAVNGAGNPICQARRPFEDPSDPAWVAYQECVNEIGRTRIDCVENVWAPLKGITGFCTEGGNAVAECNPILPPITTPPTGGTCTPVELPCPACFKNGENVAIDKQVIGSGMVAKGERAKYEIAVNGLETDNSQFRLNELTVRVYDRIIPADSGWIWGLNPGAYVDGDEGGSWNWNGSYFERTFGASSEVVRSLNTTGTLSAAAREDLKVHYDLDTALAVDADEADVKNVAFATMTYDYQQRSVDAAGNTVWLDSSVDKTVGLDDTCDAIDAADLHEFFKTRYAADSTYGAQASLRIIRPFVEARGGNVAVRGTERVTGNAHAITQNTDHGIAGTHTTIVQDQNTDLTLSTYDFVDVDFDALTDGLGTNDDYFANLEGSMTNGTLPDGIEIEAGVDVEVLTHTHNSGVYLITSDGGNIIINDEIDLSVPSTFILRGTGLIIEQDVTFADHFGAFITQEHNGFTGDIAIKNTVNRLDGVYIAEDDSGITSLGVNNTDTLQVNGNLIGDISHLLSFRKYIGASIDSPEPSLLVSFDLRLLESTPPILEQFLGQNWREEVSQ